MAVPSVMAELSTTAASNSPAGTESPSNADDFLRAIQAIVRTTNAKGSDIASAATTDIGAATAEFVDVTGTTTITALGTIAAGIVRTVRFTGALTLTHNATSLILPGGANITTAANDRAVFRSLGSGNWLCVLYVKASGEAVSAFSDANAVVVGSADATKKIRFEVDGLTTATTRVLTVQDKDITVAGLSDILPSKYIAGLVQSNNSGDATNDIDISAGSCSDATGVTLITLSAITKRSDANWAVGTNQGGLDTGSVGNSDYYIWAIKRSDTGVCDVLFSLSSTAPTMPANYDYKRLIGWFKRVSATIVPFTAYEIEGGGLEVLWTTPTLDINLANTLTTTRRTDAVKVPLNFSVKANLNVLIDDGSLNSAWIYCPDQADLAPSDSAAPLETLRSSVTGQPSAQNITIRTSSTGTIAARSVVASVNLYAASTLGFTWARRN
jgi:hypothetical protein